jgi:hypothetical protein
MSYADELAEVQAAITAILGGAQEYSKGDLSVTKADLKVLMDERRELRILAAKEARGRTGPRTRGITPVN